MSDELLDTKKDLLESRISARAKLNDPSQPPRFFFTVVAPNRDKDGVLHPPIEPNYNVARSGNFVYHRRTDESLEDFRERAMSHWPANGVGWPFTFLSFEEPESELPEKPATAPTQA